MTNVSATFGGLFSAIIKRLIQISVKIKMQKIIKVLKIKKFAFHFYVLITFFLFYFFFIITTIDNFK